MKNRLQEDLIEAGKYGRDPQRRVERYEDLDEQIGVNRPEGTQANTQLRDFAMTRMKDSATLSVAKKVVKAAKSRSCAVRIWTVS
jgi:hypothetical protein